MKHFNVISFGFLNKSIVAIGLWLLCYTQAFANNVAVSSVALNGQNATLKYINVQFNIAWENSWRVASGPTNWDACWVFVKYRKKNTTVWNHATLNYSTGTAAADGHTEPANSTITGVSDGKGIFIYRSAAMAQGSVSYTSAKLRWNYGVNGLLNTDFVEVAVFALEMVYVPQGSFYLGSGGAEGGHFYTYPTSTATYQVTSENAITVGTTAGNLYYAPTALQGDGAGPIPAAYPKGYTAFYCMKYGITQADYVAFLNKLTYTQQVDRTAIAPNSVAGSAPLTRANRNGIEIKTAGVSTATPAVYACELDNDGIYDEVTDGRSIACNLIQWEDIIAYLDWAALRPMTEMEYEKVCRGTATPVANEYPWGNTTNVSATGVTNSGNITEIATNATATSVSAAAGVTGPMRVGNFADATSTRATSGATFYGILDMGGNLWQYIITAGHATGRNYTGINGDGALDAAGDANTSGWPLAVAGTGFRGGNWNWAITAMRVSDRTYAANAQAGRYLSFGGRGVREP